MNKRNIASFLGVFGVVVFGFGLVLGFIFILFDLDKFPFFKGLLAAHFLVGFIALVVWGVITGVSASQHAKQLVTGRSTRYGALALAYSLVFVGLLTLGNWFASRYSKDWDLSEQNVNSLASQTTELLHGLQKPLRLVGFKTTPEQNEIMSALFERYRSAASSKVKIEIIDPRVKPHLVDSYQMQPGNLIYIEYGEPGETGVSRVNAAAEQDITNAILRLTRGVAKKVYYVQGHGEPSLEGADERGIKGLATALEDEHYKVAGLQLSAEGKVPDDAVAVVLAAPKKPLLAAERDLLVAYANNGGRLILFHDPLAGEDVRQIATQFGIEVGKNIVIDQVQLLGASALGAQPYVTQYGAHPITKQLGEQSPTVFNIASTVSKRNEAPSTDGVTIVELAKTSPRSWAEVDLGMLLGEKPSAAKGIDDVPGPLSLAVAYERPIKKAQDAASGSAKPTGEFSSVARVVVFGDVDFVLNDSFSLLSNRDLFVNALNWTTGQEGGVTLPTRAIRASKAPINQETFLKIFTGSFLLPELILILGSAVWWRRRSMSVA